MIFTYIPSNILLILISLTGNKTVAIAFFLLKLYISQMDVLLSKAEYCSMVVSSSERRAANGITNIVRTMEVAISLLKPFMV